MSYCSRCGVEIVPWRPFCPLCSAPIPNWDHAEPPAYPHESQDQNQTFLSRHPRLKAYVVLTVVLATVVLIVAGINQAIVGRLTWSVLPIVTVAFFDLAMSSLLLKKWLSYSLLCVTSMLYLAVLNALTATNLTYSLTWFWPLGLPLTVLAWLVGTASYFIFRRPGFRGWDIPGFSLLLAALFCCGLDALVTHLLKGSWGLGWSLVVSLAVIPLALFFLFLHFVLHKRILWEQILHL